ncbi:MAG: hypothetical protein R6W82_02200 [bacterium]
MAGGTKLFSPVETSEAIYAYLPLKPILLRMLIWFVSIIEIGIGTVLVLQMANPSRTSSLIIALIGFSLFLGVSIGRYIITDDGGCGCFGSLEILSSPIPALGRDVVLLGTAATSLILEDARRAATIGLLMALPLVTAGNLSLSLANGLDQFPASGLQHEKGSESQWYGLSIETVNGQGIAAIVSGSFGQGYSYGVLEEGQTIYRVQGGPRNGGLAGWVSMRMLPVPQVKWGPVYRIVAVYDSQLRLTNLDIEPPAIVPDYWPNAREMKLLVTELTGHQGHKLFDSSNNVLKSRESEVLGAFIIKALNNISYNLLYSLGPEGLGGPG